MGINSWLEDELYQQYLHDRTAVDDEWKHLFEGNGGATPVSTAPAPKPAAAEPVLSGDLQPLRGIAGRIAENMAASVSIPLATSQRTIAVKGQRRRKVVNGRHA